MADVLTEYVRDMRTAKYSPVTISDRMELLRRLAAFLDGTPLLDATGADLRRFQAQFIHLAPATLDIYTRHTKALYAWAMKRRLISENPADEMITPKVPKGLPHPTTPEELRLIFAVTRGPLRLAYTLAAFAGLRRGEICRMHRRDLHLNQREPTALIHGKGNRERLVPLLAPVVDEIQAFGLMHGWVLTINGKPYPPERLSADSSLHLHSLGLQTTLHSMRGTFATDAGRMTRDPLFVRDLLGHGSVSTTEIYLQTSMVNAHERLSGVAQQAAELLSVNGKRPGRRAQTA